MLRLVHKEETQNVLTDCKGISSISQIVRRANCGFGVKVVYDMRKVSKVDGNLASVYSALDFNLFRVENALTIWPRKACSIKVRHRKGLFGYYSNWETDLEATFLSGGTRVFAFDPYDDEKFSDYLLHDAFRKDWKRILPYHYKLDVKDYLRKLFQNASEHSNADSPIFIASSFDGEMLRFTMADCGEGFSKRVRTREPYTVGEGNAISWAMNGNSIKGKEGSKTLKSLGEYCSTNGGELLVISGGATVQYCKDSFHECGLLPAPFRGSIINLSIKIKLPEFLERSAA